MIIPQFNVQRTENFCKHIFKLKKEKKKIQNDAVTVYASATLKKKVNDFRVTRANKDTNRREPKCYNDYTIVQCAEN